MHKQKQNMKFHPFPQAGRCSAGFICSASRHTVWNIPWVSCSLSWLYVHPVPCAPPASLLGRLYEEQKRSGLRKFCSSITKTSLNYQYCFQHKSKTQPHTNYYKVNYFYCGQNQHKVIISSNALQSRFYINVSCFSIHVQCTKKFPSAVHYSWSVTWRR